MSQLAGALIHFLFWCLLALAGLASGAGRVLATGILFGTITLVILIGACIDAIADALD